MGWEKVFANGNSSEIVVYRPDSDVELEYVLIKKPYFSD